MDANRNGKDVRNGEDVFKRWALIGKHQRRTKPANAKPVTRGFDIEATRKAFSMALDMPMGKHELSTLRSGASQQRTHHPAPVFRAAVSQANPTNAPSLIQAAATAAGGRIITPRLAPNLREAEQFTNFVHIRSRGTGPSKTSTSSKASTMASEPGTRPGSAQHPELLPNYAPAPSPPVSTTQATMQVNVMPKVAVVNRPEQSASVHLLETDRALSTAPVSAPCEDLEMDDESSFCVVTMEDLLTEDMEQLHIVDLNAEEMIDPEDADLVIVGRHEVDGPSVNNSK